VRTAPPPLSRTSLVSPLLWLHREEAVRFRVRQGGVSDGGTRPRLGCERLGHRASPLGERRNADGTFSFLDYVVDDVDDVPDPSISDREKALDLFFSRQQ